MNIFYLYEYRSENHLFILAVPVDTEEIVQSMIEKQYNEKFTATKLG